MRRSSEVDMPIVPLLGAPHGDIQEGEPPNARNSACLHYRIPAHTGQTRTLCAMPPYAKIRYGIFVAGREVAQCLASLPRDRPLAEPIMTVKHVGVRNLMPNNILRYVLILALGLAAAGLSAAQNQRDVVDAILATVGDEVILMSEVRAEIAPALFELRQEDLSSEEYEQRREELFEEALDQAVENLILVREARRRGMQVPDHAIEDRLEELRGRYPSREAFLEDIQQAGETLSDIRARLRRQVLALNMSMLQREQFEQAVVVSEDEAVQYYQDNLEYFRRPGRVRVRQIFLSAEGEEEQAGAREQAEALLGEIEAGETFEDLAREHSEAPGAADGGLVGWQQRGDLIEPLDSAAFELEEGEVSDVLETDFGVHIVKVDEREEEGHVAFEQVRSQTINHLRQQKADARYDRWMADQRRRAGVQMFAEGRL